MAPVRRSLPRTSVQFSNGRLVVTCVNTVDDWRDMKVGIFSKRQRGESTSPGEWDSRVLPQPLARIVFAAIEESVSFGSRWKAWRKRLGLADNSSITMLSDGAKWLREEQRKHLTLADGVLDIFHVLEHITATRQALCSDPGLTIREQTRPGQHGPQRMAEFRVCYHCLRWRLCQNLLTARSAAADIVTESQMDSEFPYKQMTRPIEP